MQIAQTKRMTLHRFSENDIEGFYNLNADSRNIRYTGDKSFKSLAQTAVFIKAYDHYQRYGFGRWSLYSKQNGQYIGFCGLRYVQQTKQVDVGYRIMHQYWGKGLATEATRAALDIGFKQYALKQIISRTRQDNPASIKVLLKAGFEQIGNEVEDDHQWLTFCLKRDDYL
jgi:RimJ/RimL family protein N-acetyltransferase